MNAEWTDSIKQFPSEEGLYWVTVIILNKSRSRKTMLLRIVCYEGELTWEGMDFPYAVTAWIKLPETPYQK